MTPGEPGRPAMTPGEPGRPAMTPGEPGRPAMTPGDPGRPAMTPGDPGRPAMTPGDPGDDGAAAAFRVLCVCIANQCRSPMMERLIRREVAFRLGPDAHHWSVTSAGVRAVDGQPMHRLAGQTLRLLGTDADEFTARRVSLPQVRGADLVLAATADERDSLIAAVPAAIGRTYTLLEFARLAAAVPAATLAATPDDVTTRAVAVVAAARGMRGRTPYVDPALDDLEDPPRTAEAFSECAGAIGRAVHAALDALCAETRYAPGPPDIPGAGFRTGWSQAGAAGG